MSLESYMEVPEGKEEDIWPDDVVMVKNSEGGWDKGNVKRIERRKSVGSEKMVYRFLVSPLSEQFVFKHNLY